MSVHENGYPYFVFSREHEDEKILLDMVENIFYNLITDADEPETIIFYLERNREFMCNTHWGVKYRIQLGKI